MKGFVVSRDLYSKPSHIYKLRRMKIKITVNYAPIEQIGVCMIYFLQKNKACLSNYFMIFTGEDSNCEWNASPFLIYFYRRSSSLFASSLYYADTENVFDSLSPICLELQTSLLAKLLRVLLYSIMNCRIGK